MIHHLSFGVTDPAGVAAALSELTGGRPMKAPSPPFPYGSWFVMAGDDRGSLIEILPAATVFDPEAPLGIRQQARAIAHSNTHALLGSCRNSEEIAGIAAREGWRRQVTGTGLFRVTKLWIDEKVLVELLAAEDVGRYVAAFGANGMADIEGRLREIETTMASVLASKLTAGQLREALGEAPY